MDLWKFVFDHCIFNSNIQIHTILITRRIFQRREIFNNFELYRGSNKKNTIKNSHGFVKVCLWSLHFQLKHSNSRYSDDKTNILWKTDLQLFWIIPREQKKNTIKNSLGFLKIFLWSFHFQLKHSNSRYSDDETNILW